MGRRVCERFGAKPSPVGYLPDSFGHPLQLPQILAGFGIDSFVFSRGLGDELDELGVVFRWRAPDYSEVLACQQLPNYGNFGHVTDARDALERIEAIAQQFAAALERTGGREMLLCAGDDHLPVRRDLPALCAELQARLPESEFRIARYSDYVDAVKGPNRPVHTGELLGSRVQNILRGVNSARLYLKQANERAERRLLDAETLSALHSLRTGEPFPVSDFRLAWRQLLRCQPHDSICGCSCDEVHRDMLVRYSLLDRQVGELERRALPGDGRAESIGVANPLPERRRALVTVPDAEPLVVELEGFSARTIELTPATATRPTSATSIESDCLRVEARPDGTLSIIDKPSGRRFDGLHRFEDELDAGDLYNFCPVPGAPVWRSDGAATRVLRDGPVVWELELRIAGPLSPTTVVRLIKGIRRVEFHTTIENRTRDHRVRAVFPTGAPGSGGTVRAEGQFALVQRALHPPEPQTAWVEPPDPTQHTSGAVALGPLALLTKGLPEYEARPTDHGPELCLTLLRAVGLISRPSGAIVTRPLGAGPALPTPEGQCLGTHVLEYALLPGADVLDATALLRASMDYRHPFVLAPAGTQLDSPLSIEGDAVFSCLKGAEDGDGLILRCFNPSDARVQARIAGDFTVSRARLDETDAPGQSTELEPGQILSLRLRV